MRTQRMMLTLLEHQGEIWQVHLTAARDGEPAERMQLEFERAGEVEKPLRYTRTLSGPLLTALQEGKTLSRSSLSSELEQALGEDTPVEPAAAPSRMRPWQPLGES